jgi:hypothetical protein
MPNLLFSKGASRERKLKLETNVVCWFFAFSKNRRFQVFKKSESKNWSVPRTSKTAKAKNR